MPRGHHRGTAQLREPTEQHRHATADVYRRRYLRQCQPRQPHGAARHPQGNATDGLLRPRPRTGEAVAAGHRGTMARRATRQGRSAVLHSARLAARPSDAVPGVAHLRDICFQGGRADGARIPRGRHAAAYRMGAGRLGVGHATADAGGALVPDPKERQDGAGRRGRLHRGGIPGRRERAGSHLHQLQRAEPDSLQSHPRVCHASRSHVLEPHGRQILPHDPKRTELATRSPDEGRNQVHGSGQDLEGRTLCLSRSCRRARTGRLRERPLRHAGGG